MMDIGSTPASRAARLTAQKPGISGPRTGSTMASEFRDAPRSLASPPRMAATYTTQDFRKLSQASTNMGKQSPHRKLPQVQNQEAPVSNIQSQCHLVSTLSLTKQLWSNTEAHSGRFDTGLRQWLWTDKEEVGIAAGCP